ncbi:30S ribosomal protein S7 [Candidatus Entotheonellaceae bacterium PAL068K]
MSRRKVVAKRRIPPDPKYGDVLITRCVNVLMKEGKKNLAERIIYGALEILQERTGEEPLQMFKQAVENVKPVLEVKSRRVGGSTYQIPVDVNPDRRIALSMRWLIGCARSRGERGMIRRLAAELLDAYNNTGSAVKKKEDTHRMAEANKAFAHYRW